MFSSEHNSQEKQARIGVLDDLIKYMRRLELEKDMPKDALTEGLNEVVDKMTPEGEEEEHHLDEERTENEHPEAILEIEAGPKEEMSSEELEELPGEALEEELSPFQQKMKDYFNNRDRPKVGKSMSFVMATKTPASKSIKPMVDDEMNERKKGKSFKK